MHADLNAPLDRRRFLTQTSASVAGLAALGALPAARGADAPSRRVVVGVIGLGRGSDHVKALLQIRGVEVAWLCDVDANRLAQAAKLVVGKQERTPQTTQDLRRILDDRGVGGSRKLRQLDHHERGDLPKDGRYWWHLSG